MEKIDRRKKYYIVLDTETCPCMPSNEVNPFNMFVYDLGFAVVDKHGTVYETKSFVIKDIFTLEKELMNSAYYSNKLPQYYKDIKKGTRKLVSFYNARQELIKTMKKYNINTVIAHNAYFDYSTLQNTQRWLTKSKYRNFFPTDTIIWDTMKMAQDTICKQPTYKKYCTKNNYLTKNGQVRKTAEILYRYISQDNNFIESHTGLEDVLIEKEIFVKCMAQHKKMRKTLWTDIPSTSKLILRRHHV